MSAKNLDNHNRWRNRQVAFRLSPEEADLLDAFVKISGLTKQDYITQCLLTNSVVVQGNPRVYKALRDSMAAIHAELQRIEAGTTFMWCTSRLWKNKSSGANAARINP